VKSQVASPKRSNWSLPSCNSAVPCSFPVRLGFLRRPTSVSKPHSMCPFIQTSLVSKYTLYVHWVYHFIPHGNNRLHIDIARKEAYQSVGYNLTHFHQDVAVITNHCGVISHFELGADGNLITTPGYDKGTNAVSRQSHGVAFLNERLKAKHFGIHF
jgi:hypothetical protein